MMSTAVVVTNVDTSITEANVQELFSTLGAISGMQNLGMVGGAGVQTFMLTFAQPAGAQSAVMLNGTPLGPKAIQVALVPAADGAAAPAATAPVADPSLSMVGLNPLMPGFNASLNAAAAAGAVAAAASAPLLPSQGQQVESLGNIGGRGVMVVIPDAVTIPKGMSTDPKSDEIARTIYADNLGPEITSEAVETFFKVCGGLNRVIMAANGGHAFVEFRERTGAQAALVLNGQPLGTRLVKVGLAKNVLVKPQKTTADQKKMEDAMRKVRAAQARLSNISAKKDDDGDNSSSRMRADGARSRSRNRSRERHRSNSRDRRRDSRRSPARSSRRDEDRRSSDYRRDSRRDSRRRRSRSRDKDRRRSSDRKRRERSESRDKDKKEDEEDQKKEDDKGGKEPAKKAEVDDTELGIRLLEEMEA